MDHLVTISGHIVLVYLKAEALLIRKEITVHVATLTILAIIIHHLSLETTTTVNQATQLMDSPGVYCTPMIQSEMARSVKASVAAMEDLLHGLVHSYPIQRLTILRCAFAVLYHLVITLQYNYWSSMSSNKRGKQTNKQ